MVKVQYPKQFQFWMNDRIGYILKKQTFLLKKCFVLYETQALITFRVDKMNDGIFTIYDLQSHLWRRCRCPRNRVLKDSD